MHETHRRAARSTRWRHRRIAPPRNTTKKGTTERPSGIRNERWNGRTTLTSLQKRPTTSRGRWRVSKCLLVTTTDRITRTTNGPLSCTIVPPTLIEAPRKPMRNKTHQTGQELSRRALEHSQQAYEQTEQTHRTAVNEHGVATFGHAEIAALAHTLWESRGSPVGSAEEDWFHAAQELRARGEGPRKGT